MKSSFRHIDGFQIEAHSSDVPWRPSSASSDPARSLTVTLTETPVRRRPATGANKEIQPVVVLGAFI